MPRNSIKEISNFINDCLRLCESKIILLVGQYGSGRTSTLRALESTFSDRMETKYWNVSSFPNLTDFIRELVIHESRAAQLILIDELDDLMLRISSLPEKEASIRVLEQQLYDRIIRRDYVTVIVISLLPASLDHDVTFRRIFDRSHKICLLDS